jgi:hypothetical protein
MEMKRKPILLLLGGSYHDFDGFANAMSPGLQEKGYAIEATYDLTTLTGLGEHKFDIVIFYTCIGSARQNGERPPGPTPAQTGALAEWVKAGGGLLAVHATTVAGQTNPEFAQLVGGVFISHPPQFNFTVYPMFREHPIIKDIASFTVFDEFYAQNYDPTVEVHAVAFDRGVAYPMIWSKNEGKGRVAHIALGHSERVWTLPAYQQLIGQAVDWLVE